MKIDPHRDDNLYNAITEMTVKEDPQGSHDCAKEIMKLLKIPYDVFTMYSIVGVLHKYVKEYK